MKNPEFDDDLVLSLLREQHPDLAELDLRRVPGGWDNQMWRLGDDLAVRLPRTARAPSLLHKEWRWLPVLGPHLPLPIPVPTRIGRPSAAFSNPWAIVIWVSGEPADSTPISHGDHAADTLADFLRALHQAAPHDAPSSPNRGVALEAVAAEFDERFHAVADSDIPAADIRRLWDEAVAAPEWQGPPFWLHGDLHPANVVVSDGTLSGVIDFGELCAGDPATDLAAAWLILPEGAHRRFLDAYDGADEGMIRRARGWALLRGLSLIGIGHAWDRGLPGGKPTWGRAGRATIDRVLASR